jgi:ribonucleoside-diphosphate reductase alpha chain
LITVTKRNGSKEPLNIDQIYKQVIPACEGLNCPPDDLLSSCKISFNNEIKTTDIQQILIETAQSKVDVDTPEWTYVSARLSLYDLYHSIKKAYKKSGSGNVYDAITIQDHINKNKGTLNIDTTKYDMEKIQNAIVSDRDKLFTSIGVQMLKSKYLKKNELPQHRFMTIAMWLADTTEEAIEFYDLFSKTDFLPATPILAKGGIKDSSHASCLVGSIADTTNSILDMLTSFAKESSRGSGWGIEATRIRALGGMINGVKGIAGGLVPHLKILDTACFAWDQREQNRPGAANITVECWHRDIFDFIDMKKTSGEELRRAKQLLITVSLNDLFMERVKSDGQWILFDPYDVPNLTEVWGNEFEELYLHYESKLQSELGSNEKESSFTNPPVTIKAKDLFRVIVLSYFETGNPLLFFKDTANRLHPNPEFGIVRSSNLCQEIIQSTDEDHTAVCNLGSINLANYQGEDWLRKTVNTAMRVLNKVIDKTDLLDEKAVRSQKRSRAVGLGIFNEHTLIANNCIMYGSKEHMEFIEPIYKIYADESDKFTENKYRRAIAPTATISTLVGGSAGHEPVFAKKWFEESKAGKFPMVPPSMTPENYPYWLNAYEVDQFDAIRLTAMRQKYIDQSISHNIYLNPEKTTGKTISDLIMFAHEQGLKTTYYLRTDSTKVAEADCEACG